MISKIKENVVVIKSQLISLKWHRAYFNKCKSYTTLRLGRSRHGSFRGRRDCTWYKRQTTATNLQSYTAVLIFTRFISEVCNRFKSRPFPESNEMRIFPTQLANIFIACCHQYELWGNKQTATKHKINLKD